MSTRVLHMIGQIGVGGCEKQLLELCRRLDPAKFTLGVCYYSPNADNMVREFEEAGVQLFFVNKFGGISSWRFFQTLRSYVHEFRPDLIHCWMYSANMWGRLAGWSCGYRKIIASERTIASYPWPSRILSRFLVRRTVWTANTNAVADHISKTRNIDRSAIHVIHNAVEMPLLDKETCRKEVRAELGLSPTTAIVLTVGRQTPAKNYPMFYRVARRVIQQRPDVVFVSVGHGEEESRLRHLHQELKLEGSLRMLGLRHDVPRLMAAADIFCLCSRWEGFPNVLVEAMASSLPVVTTAFAGAREVVDDGDRSCGIMVGIDRDDQMAEQIIELLSNPQRRQTLGQVSCESVRRRFSWPHMLERVENLYQEVLTATS